MNRKVLKLATPNIISNITVPLLGMADIAVVGHIADASNQIGAIAIGGMIFSFIYMTLSFLRASSAGLTAQAFGKHDKSEIKGIFVRASFLALILAASILLLQVPIEWLSFKILEAEPQVETFAASYFSVRIWAAPATLMLYVFNGWYIGMQNTRTPMYIAILGNLLNIGFNYYFVYIKGMRAEGVALGTLLAQYLSLILAIVFMLKQYPEYLKKLDIKAKLVKSKIVSLLSMNRDLFIRSFILIFVLSFFTVSSAKLSTDILAVNSILFQFFLFFSFFMDGFAYAAEALTGKYIGQNSLPKLKKAIKITFSWGFYLSLPFTFLYAFQDEWILSLLTDDANIARLAQEYHMWIVIIPLLTFASFLWDGIYIGATAVKPIRDTMIVSGLLIFLPAYYMLLPYMGNHALWLAFSLFMFGRGFFMTLWYKKAILSPFIKS
jgi:MATE family multidrug resistance protein